MRAPLTSISQIQKGEGTEITGECWQRTERKESGAACPACLKQSGILFLPSFMQVWQWQLSIPVDLGLRAP